MSRRLVKRSIVSTQVMKPLINSGPLTNLSTATVSSPALNAVSVKRDWAQQDDKIWGSPKLELEQVLWLMYDSYLVRGVWMHGVGPWAKAQPNPRTIRSPCRYQQSDSSPHGVTGAEAGSGLMLDGQFPLRVPSSRPKGQHALGGRPGCAGVAARVTHHSQPEGILQWAGNASRVLARKRICTLGGGRPGGSE
jgi:hypothetical protein